MEGRMTVHEQAYLLTAELFVLSFAAIFAFWFADKVATKFFWQPVTAVRPGPGGNSATGSRRFARRANQCWLSENVSSPRIKNISLFQKGKSVVYLSPSRPD